MKARHRTAIELLLSHPDTTVAEMLGIRLATLKSWMEMEGFQEALRAREREQESGARRIARQAVVDSAATLCQLAANTAKPDPKILLEVLKVSGVFDERAEEPGAALAEVMKQARKKLEDAHAGVE